MEKLEKEYRYYEVYCMTFEDAYSVAKTLEVGLGADPKVWQTLIKGISTISSVDKPINPRYCIPHEVIR
jgi:hypothetical protein